MPHNIISHSPRVIHNSLFLPPRAINVTDVIKISGGANSMPPVNGSLIQSSSPDYSKYLGIKSKVDFWLGYLITVIAYYNQFNTLKHFFKDMFSRLSDKDSEASFVGSINDLNSEVSEDGSITLPLSIKAVNKKAAKIVNYLEGVNFNINLAKHDAENLQYLFQKSLKHSQSTNSQILEKVPQMSYPAQFLMLNRNIVKSALLIPITLLSVAEVICNTKSAGTFSEDIGQCIKSLVSDNVKSYVATFAISVASAFVIAKIVDACLPENEVCLPEAEVVGNVSE